MATIIMVGNPGSGKSTLLSSLVEQPLFPSGVSIGGGKTTEFKEVVYQGNTYIDTPGLSDVKLREKAALEIEKAFKRGGLFKVFFVITLESGRVKPNDLATMKLVLDSLPQIGPNGYSIIINKVSAAIISELNNSNDKREELAAYLAPSINHGTRSICYVPLDQKIIDQSDMLYEVTPELVSFIDVAPSIRISSDQVYQSLYTKFKEIFKEMQVLIQQLREDNEKLRQAIAEQDRKLGEIRWFMLLGPEIPQLAKASPQNSIIFINNSTKFAAWEHSVLMHIVESIGYDKTKFTNTDGLSDSKIRNNAAKSIESTFQEGGNFKVFFIVQFSSGRIKPQHLVTIQLVLQAVPQIKDQYSVIVILSKKSYDAVHHTRDLFPDSIQYRPHAYRPHAQYFCIPEDHDWTAQNSKLREGLRGFMERTPETTITAGQVQSINQEHFSNILSSFSTTMDKLAFWRR